MSISVSRRAGIVCLLSATLALAPRMAPGQTDEQKTTARAAAQAGLEALDAQKWREALDYFTRAESILHAPVHVYYIGFARMKLGQLVAARESFLALANETIPASAPKAFRDAQTDAAKELTGLERRIASLKISVSPAAKNLMLVVDGKEMSGAIVDIPTPFDPGGHTLVARGDGFASAPVSVTLKDGAKETVAITMQPIAVAPTASAVLSSAPAPSASAAPSSPEPPRPPNDSLRVPAYAALGAGALGIVVGTIFAVRSHGKRTDLEALCPAARCPESKRGEHDSLASSATTSGRVAVVGFGFGAAGLAAGATMLILNGRGGSAAASSTISPAFSLSSVGLSGDSYLRCALRYDVRGMSDTEIAEGFVLAGKYKLVRLIGRGGMGSVWEALHTSLGKSVALKFIDGAGALGEEAAARFETEARAAARLDSRYVATVYDHGVSDGRPYIVMELLRGEPLSARLERQSVLSPADTSVLFGKIGRALGKAHDLGIIHRDLKPENIFLHQSDDEEIPKIVDFGIAKLGGEQFAVTSTTRTGNLMGTPFYMSPEQTRGLKSLDHRTDLWSLAVMVYQCLVGVPPFDGATIGDLFVKICIEEAPAPRSIAPTLPPGIDAWMRRALSHDPDARFATGAELASTLAVALGTASSEPSSLRGASLAPLPSSPVISVSPTPTYGSNAALTRTQPDPPVEVPPKSRAGLVAVAAAAGLVVAGAIVFAARPSPSRPAAGLVSLPSPSAATGVAPPPSADPSAASPAVDPAPPAASSVAVVATTDAKKAPPVKGPPLPTTKLNTAGLGT